MPHLPTKELNNLVEHCSNVNELLIKSEKYNTYILVIACAFTHLAELSTILPGIPIDSLYILNVEDETRHSNEPWWNRTTIVYTEQQLMRHLCTKSMLCLYNEGLAHRQNGDFGLANRSFLDSLNALDYSAKFI